MNVKAEKYNKFLKEKGINFFNIEDREKDEMHPVVYRSFMEINGQNLPVWIVIDDSIYMMIHVRLGSKLLKDGNRVALLDYFNSMNAHYKVFKYYADGDGDVLLESCISVGPVDSFEPEIIHVVLDVIVKHLTKEFATLMKLVWADYGTATTTAFSAAPTTGSSGYSF